MLQQLISFNLDGNFDAVMSLIGCVIGLEEIHNTSRSKESLERYSIIDQEFIDKITNNKRLFR